MTKTSLAIERLNASRERLAEVIHTQPPASAPLQEASALVNAAIGPIVERHPWASLALAAATGGLLVWARPSLSALKSPMVAAMVPLALAKLGAPGPGSASLLLKGLELYRLFSKAQPIPPAGNKSEEAFRS